MLRDDGLVGCIGLVPPPSKRALTFVDPSYEVRDEHRTSSTPSSSSRSASRRASSRSGIPSSSGAGSTVTSARCARPASRSIATYELCVARERRGGGLIGSGMFVVNPPWQLDEELAVALPWLVERLAVDDGASYRAEQPDAAGPTPTRR